MHTRQVVAEATVASALDSAVRIIDQKFGPEYAKKNPALTSDIVEIIVEISAAKELYKLEPESNVG